MATGLLEDKSIGYLLKAAANFIKLPRTKMWLDYDVEADGLYLHFEDLDLDKSK